VPNAGYVACGGTHLMRNGLFQAGAQHRHRAFLRDYADFLADYVAIVQKKNAAYERFLQESIRSLEDWRKQEAANAGLAAYLDTMLEAARDAESGYYRKMDYEGGKTWQAHIEKGDKIAARLKELLDMEGTELFPECNALIEELNSLSWAHDEHVGMRFSMSTREWAQAAAFGCAALPEAVPYAERIRAGIRDALDGAPPW
jgi:hypothetical protein